MNFRGLNGLDYASSLGKPYRFKPSMSAKFREDMFDVILNRSRADVELVSDGSCGMALC